MFIFDSFQFQSRAIVPNNILKGVGKKSVHFLTPCVNTQNESNKVKTVSYLILFHQKLIFGKQ